MNQSDELRQAEERLRRWNSGDIAAMASEQDLHCVRAVLADAYLAKTATELRVTQAAERLRRLRQGDSFGSVYPDVASPWRDEQLVIDAYLAATSPDDGTALCAWCSEPKDAHAESGLCRGTTSQYFTRKAQNQQDDVSRDWRSIAIALYERAVWFFHRKSEEFKSKPELDKITQANGCEGWISTLAANWHNEFATDLSRIMPPEIDMPAAPDDGEAIDEEGHWSTGLFNVEVVGYSSRYAVLLSDCDNEVSEDLHHIKTKQQLRNLLEALGAE